MHPDAWDWKYEGSYDELKWHEGETPKSWEDDFDTLIGNLQEKRNQIHFVNEQIDGVMQNLIDETNEAKRDALFVDLQYLISRRSDYILSLKKANEFWRNLDAS